MKFEYPFHLFSCSVLRTLIKSHSKTTPVANPELLILHNRIEAVTYKQADSHLFCTQRDQFSPVVMSTAQIIKCQKLSINANLSTSLRYQQKALVEIHMKRSQGQGVAGENRLE